MGLDNSDVNILNILQGNGRLSYRQISEKVKVSVPTVSSKVGNLERIGVIRGYHAELDPERLGELSAMVSIKARPAELSSVAAHFKDDEQVRQMFFLSSGRLMLICTFVEAHMINDFAAKVGAIPEVLEYDIANVISVAKELDRAVIAPGLNLVFQCMQCGKDIRDEPLKVRDGGRNIYLCSAECINATRSRMARPG
ncbi:MAG: winged helix-turn-helix transcriptional regulator [Methanomassiliicoccus sp.]|nr:winged helix-turn-helix transcriptional regulator [Methanomassiliicoccus sp.]